jgi:hypothetical protein
MVERVLASATMGDVTLVRPIVKSGKRANRRRDGRLAASATWR